MTPADRKAVVEITLSRWSTEASFEEELEDWTPPHPKELAKFAPVSDALLERMGGILDDTLRQWDEHGIVNTLLTEGR